MKIDTHTHIWNDLEFSKGVKRYVPDYLFTQENLEKIMKSYDIEKAVLVQPSFLGNNNSLLVQTIKKNPKRYRGVIVLDDFDNYSDLKSILESYDKIGIKGIRFNLIGKKLLDFREKKYENLFSLLISLNWHLEIHANEHDLCTLLENVKEKNLRIVLDHFARPLNKSYSSEFISMLNSGLNIYVKLSANYRFKDFEIGNFVIVLIETIGNEKLLWGSDCPFTKFEDIWNYKKSIELLTRNVLTKDLSEILDENAMKLFHWK